MSLLLAGLLDFFFQDPHSPYHPIALVGRWIAWLERRLEGMRHRRWAGVLLCLFSLMGVLLPLGLAEASLPAASRQLLQVMFMFFFLAGGSLADAGQGMLASLRQEPLAVSRRRMAMLVGRDTSELSRDEITCATIETVAENTIDAFFAPFFYMAVGHWVGLPLLFGAAYKVINTLDSMVAYHNPRYEEFGRCAARLDDVINYLPARLGVVFMGLAGLMLGLPARRAWRLMRRDGRKHLSPNAGLPEALVAGFLGIRLGGTHRYHGVLIEKPTIGDPLEVVDEAMIQASVRLLKGTQVMTLILWTVLWTVCVWL